MTYQFKEYKNPPIKEAIFSISFKVPLTPEQIENFKNTDYVKIKFPIQEDKDELVINVIKKEESAANINQIVNKGYRLRNNDNLININATQISYHSINKYKGWDNVIVELKDLFSLLSEKNNTLSISQISTRYVNQIILPDSFKNIHEYINLLPNIPKELNPLNNFFLQINTSDSNLGLTGTITETILPQKSTENNLTFLLDINVFKIMQNNSNDIWETFTCIRSFKNKLFANCITSKTEALFN